MRLHRFYIKEKIGELKEITISDSTLIHQWTKVFRFRSGQRVILFDNSGFEFEAEIVSLTKKEAHCSIIDMKESLRKDKENMKNVDKKVWLFQSVIKKDNFEWIVEKATELGVSHIVPMLSERSEKKSLNFERLHRIMIEASEQSGRVILPELHEMMSLEEVLKNQDVEMIVFDPSGNTFDTRSTSTSLSAISTGVLIGPEGGWSERELEMMKEKNIPIYSLPGNILRAETAAIATMSLLLLQ